MNKEETAQITETDWVCTCGTTNKLEKEQSEQKCSKCGRSRNYVLKYHTKPEDKGLVEEVIKETLEPQSRPKSKPKINYNTLDKQILISINDEDPPSKKKTQSSGCLVYCILLIIPAIVFFARLNVLINGGLYELAGSFPSVGDLVAIFLLLLVLIVKISRSSKV